MIVDDPNATVPSRSAGRGTAAVTRRWALVRSPVDEGTVAAPFVTVSAAPQHQAHLATAAGLLVPVLAS